MSDTIEYLPSDGRELVYGTVLEMVLRTIHRYRDASLRFELQCNPLLEAMAREACSAPREQQDGSFASNSLTDFQIDVVVQPAVDNWQLRVVECFPS
jgi:hypothetical protein